MPLLNRPSADMSSAIPHSMPNRRSADPWARVRVWRLRYVPVRAALVAVLAVAFGLWVAHRVIPSVPIGEITNSVSRHGSEDGIIPAWLRLCAAQFPLYVLIFCAGLTRFSGALTNGVLLASGMADGATLALLWYVSGHGIAPAAVPVAYLLRVAVELILRVCMATAACRLARYMDDRQDDRRDDHGGGNGPLLRRIARYAATFLLVIAATAAACLGYVVLAF